MKKVNVKMIMVVMVVIAMISLISSAVYATGDAQNLALQQAQVTEDPNIHTIRELPDNTTQQAQNTTQLPTTTQNLTGGKNTVLPKTGVDDTAMWVFIVISAVAAVYTYKKVREYNA